tara:strand:- start:79 stop:249 length:171 start_codon:yes stop_codon:yes gene_type:complete
MNMRTTPTWELTRMKKALGSNVALFFNSEEENLRLMEVKRELKRRRQLASFRRKQK